MGVLPKGMVLDVPAILHLDSWAGRRTYHIRITGETRENYRIEALEDIPMPRGRLLDGRTWDQYPPPQETTR